jgi:hypothetical protein
MPAGTGEDLVDRGSRRVRRQQGREHPHSGASPGEAVQAPAVVVEGTSELEPFDCAQPARRSACRAGCEEPAELARIDIGAASISGGDDRTADGGGQVQRRAGHRVAHRHGESELCVGR